MYLALDVGGTFVKYAYMDASGKMYEQGKYPTETKDLEVFYQGIEAVLPNALEGIAISSPGVIDSDTGLIRVVTLLPCLNGVNVKEDLEARFHVPVSIENDAKCAALAEIWKGSLKDQSSALMVVLGSGIGGAVVIDGKLYKGQRSKAGEIGTLICDFDDQNATGVSFGRKNSAVWLNRDIAKALHLESADGELVFEYINQKNPIAWEIFERYCRSAAMVIFNIDYILDLDRIAIGGGISSQPILIETIREAFQDLRSRYKEDDHDPEIVVCTYKNDANLIGAMAHFVTQHLSEGE